MDIEVTFAIALAVLVGLHRTLGLNIPQVDLVIGVPGADPTEVGGRSACGSRLGARQSR